MKIKHHVNRLTTFIKKNRKLLVIVGIVLILVVTVLASFLSFKNWENYQNNYNQFFISAQKDLNNEIDRIIKNTDDSASEKLAKVIELNSQLTDESNAICQTTDLYNWQKIINSVNTEIKNCQKEKDELSNKLELIKTITNYLENEHKLSNIISNAISQTNKNNSPEKWHLIEAFWRKAISDIEKLETSQEFNSTKKLSLDYLDKIADNWETLSQANKDKDRQKFEKAQEDLVVTYSDLSKLAKSSEMQSSLFISR